MNIESEATPDVKHIVLFAGVMIAEEKAVPPQILVEVRRAWYSDRALELPGLPPAILGEANEGKWHTVEWGGLRTESVIHRSNLDLEDAVDFVNYALRSGGRMYAPAMMDALYETHSLPMVITNVSEPRERMNKPWCDIALWVGMIRIEDARQQDRNVTL